MRRFELWLFVAAMGLMLLLPRVVQAAWPWSSESKPKKSTAAKPAAKEPSALEKIAACTQTFFQDVGDTLTLKKKPFAKQSPPKTGSQFGLNPYQKNTSRQPQKKSWFGSLFSKEPEPVKSPSEFLGQKRPDWWE